MSESSFRACLDCGAMFQSRPQVYGCGKCREAFLKWLSQADVVDLELVMGRIMGPSGNSMRVQILEQVRNA